MSQKVVSAHTQCPGCGKKHPVKVTLVRTGLYCAKCTGPKCGHTRLATCQEILARPIEVEKILLHS